MSDLCCNRLPLAYSRRDMLRYAACGFGSVAFAAMAARANGFTTLLGDDDGASTSPLAPRKPHFAPRAKRIIFLCMAGAPSHVDTFDYKPGLTQRDGATFRGNSKLLGSPWKFRQSGKSGLWISDLFPNLQKQADQLCLLRGMKAEIPAHAQASIQLHTGSFQFVRPSMGSWALYGLGTENENLPGFIAINPRGDNGGSQLYGSGFLPAAYQATPVRLGNGRGNAGSGDAIPHIDNARLGTAMQREQLDLVQRLNRERLKREKQDAQLEGVIESYELAFRMQAEVPDLVTFEDEKKETLEMYGVGKQPTDSFARQCLLARRFAEKGVRFIEVSHGGWDTHRNLREEMEKQCSEIDQPIAALLADLKQRGMLDDTLVLWGGEFGRTPYAQNGDGRDHNAKGFTMWMAGGGVQGGISHGATNDIGDEAVEGVMDIHDWHATVLHLAGLDHERLTFKHAGRNFRLTDVKGRPNTAILRA